MMMMTVVVVEVAVVLVAMAVVVVAVVQFSLSTLIFMNFTRALVSSAGELLIIRG